jgi:hypothetical protein
MQFAPFYDHFDAKVCTQLLKTSAVARIVGRFLGQNRLLRRNMKGDSTFCRLGRDTAPGRH